jgi:hypothetical protein
MFWFFFLTVVGPFDPNQPGRSLGDPTEHASPIRHQASVPLQQAHRLASPQLTTVHPHTFLPMDPKPMTPAYHPQAAMSHINYHQPRYPYQRYPEDQMHGFPEGDRWPRGM